MSSEQIAELREEFAVACDEATPLDIFGNYIHYRHDLLFRGYVLARTKQATEIAELMQLAKFGAMVMRDFSALTVTKINNHALSQDLIGNGSEVKPSIEATIDKLLKG
jgi:hypothetical protein